MERLSKRLKLSPSSISESVDDIYTWNTLVLQ